ncbi:MAG: hypothetical protein ACOCZQ_00490 [Nanoarchaeota archaeon]
MRSIIFLFSYMVIFAVLFAVSTYAVFTNSSFFNYKEQAITDLIIMIGSAVGIAKTVWHIARH